MSSSSPSSSSGGVGCLTVIGIVFVILKLIGTIDWSWWYVLMPFTIELGIFIVVILVFVIAFLFSERKGKKK